METRARVLVPLALTALTLGAVAGSAAGDAIRRRAARSAGLSVEVDAGETVRPIVDTPEHYTVTVTARETREQGRVVSISLDADGDGSYDGPLDATATYREAGAERVQAFIRVYDGAWSGAEVTRHIKVVSEHWQDGGTRTGEVTVAVPLRVERVSSLEGDWVTDPGRAPEVNAAVRASLQQWVEFLCADRAAADQYWYAYRFRTHYFYLDDRTACDDTVYRLDDGRNGFGLACGGLPATLPLAEQSIDTLVEAMAPWLLPNPLGPAPAAFRLEPAVLDLAPGEEAWLTLRLDAPRDAVASFDVSSEFVDVRSWAVVAAGSETGGVRIRAIATGAGRVIATDPATGASASAEVRVAPVVDCPRELGRVPYGSVLAVAADGERTVFGSGSMLRVADVSTGAVAVLGDVEIGSAIRDVVLEGARAYVAAEAGLSVVDLADPTRPLVTSSLALGDTTAVAIWGSQLVASAMYVQWVFDLSTVGTPSVVRLAPGRLKTADLAVVGDTLLILNSHALEFDDLRAPRPEDERDSVRMPYVEGARRSAVAAEGTTAWVADGIAGVRVIDFADRSQARVVSTLPPLESATGVALARSRLLVTDGAGRLRVLGTLPGGGVHSLGEVAFEAPAVAVAATGERALVAAGSAGLRAVDLSTPAAPLESGFAAAVADAESVVLTGPLAYVTDSGGGVLRVLDLADPARPVERGALRGLSGVQNVAVNGSVGYAACWGSGLAILDLSNPDEPAVLGHLEVQAPLEAVVAGSLLLVPSYTEEQVRLYDISAPAAPVELPPLPGFAWSVRVSGPFAYLGAGHSFIVYDLHDPSHPVRIEDPPASWWYSPGHFELMGEHLVDVSDGRSTVFDVSDPARPLRLARVPGDGCDNDVAVVGSLAYLVGCRGLRVVDLADPIRGVELAAAPTRLEGLSVSVREGLVVTAEGPGGVGIYDLAACPMP